LLRTWHRWEDNIHIDFKATSTRISEPDLTTTDISSRLII
jgi:hypothetical protein